jgi:NADH:ubiquinone oxidoreductase subunit 4 (subunit M)
MNSSYINNMSLAFWAVSPVFLYNMVYSSNSPFLLYLILVPLVGALALFLIPSESIQLIKVVALNVSLFTYIASLFLWIGFDASSPNFQYLYQADWMPYGNLYFTLGIDGISLFFYYSKYFVGTHLYYARLV